MATDTKTERAAHLRSVSVTALTAVLGIAGAFISLAAAGNVPPVEAATNQITLYVLAATILVQFPLLKLSSIVDEFSGKDVFFVVFMTFSFWFISLTILLTAGVSI